MKKKKWMAVMLFIAGCYTTSCTSMNDGLDVPQSAQTGTLNLELESDTKFPINTTRAVNEQSYANTDNYTVVVTDKDGAEKLRCLGSELPTKMPLTLSIGSCRVKAFYGTEHPSSNTEFYVEGLWVGNIKADARETITLNCEPTCGKVKVNFAPEMANYYTDYKVDFTGTKAMGATSFTWNKADVDPWYLKLDPQGENVTFTITTTTKDEFINSGNKEQVFTKQGSFPLSRNKAYVMNIKPVYTPNGNGLVDFNITIDESTIDHKVDIEVPVTWI